jgi:HlyD family secretion protein
MAQQTGASAQVDIAKAQLDEALADLDSARVNLEYANILSPIDGVVVSRNVDVGQTVASSIQSPTLFTIANDLTRMKVSANIDEADIGNISEAADVRFTVDAWRDDVFRGRIEEIRLSPTITQNVVTYSVLISIDNPELKLKPGMTANVTITIDRRDNVLKAPNLALHYQPAGVPAQVPQKLAGVDTEGAFHQDPMKAPVVSGLAPGQKWKPSEKLRLGASPQLTIRAGRVWIVNAQGIPEPRTLVLGMTDGTFTEVISGPIAPGEHFIVRDSRAERAATQPGTMNPLLPQPRGGRMR